VLAHAEPAPGTPPSGTTAFAPAVDPVDDPWLSEQGPAEPVPVSVAHEQVVATWADAPKQAHARTAALRRTRLELGLGPLAAPAYVILQSATEEDPAIYSEFARSLAPDLPSIQFIHADSLWRSGDIGAAMGALGNGLWVVATTLGAQLWLVENLSFLLLVVLLAASFGYIALAGLQVFRHAAHDLGDLLSNRMPAFARSAALATLVMLPLVFGEGMIGLTLALFAVAFAYGSGRQRNMLVMAAMLLVIGLHPLSHFVSSATTLVDQDPIGRSAMAVVAGTQTRADVERLEAAFDEDLTAAHALVYHARRNGQDELARTRLDEMAKRYPSEGIVLASIGNLEMRAGHTAKAIGFYERAAAQVDSPTLLFDLSQAYANAFRMEEYESTLGRAQALGHQEVAALSSLDDAELVADLPFPTDLLRDRLHKIAMEPDSQVVLAEVLAPGRLGERWFVMASAFALITLFCLLVADRFDHASSCVRCGHRICTRCEETVWSEEICEGCHHLFQNPDATDPSLRMARLQALSKREVRIDRFVVAGSLLIPGVAGFASRRPDFAMFGLLLFAWVGAWMVWPSGRFEDPILMGSAAAFCFAVPGVLAVIAYAGIVFASLVMRKNR
jgi:tetratricopeptide (TPR) repeat protein